MRKSEKKELLAAGIVLSALLFIAFYVNIAPFFGCRSFTMGNKLQFLGAMATLNILFWSVYRISDRALPGWLYNKSIWKNIYNFTERNSLRLLFIFIVLIISWLGFVIFRNPYIYNFGHGDARLHVQLWHNLCSGRGPEISNYHDLYIGLKIYNPTFYQSIFSVVSCWLPILLLTPLYCLYPYPPMHVFAVAIVVIALGAPGIYLAIRSMKGSRVLSLCGAIGYCLMPTIELPMLHKGDPNNIGFAIYPYVFAALFSKRWGLFYIAVFLLSMMSTPYTYSVMALSMIIAIFFNARKQAIVTFLIGFLMMSWDKIVWDHVFRGLTMAVPDFFTKGNMTLYIPKLLMNIGVDIFIVLISMVSVSFLPFFGIRRQRSWNWPLIGMLVFMLAGAAMEIFRGTGWIVPRSNNVIVPLYLSAFMSYLAVFDEDKKLKHAVGSGIKKSSVLGFLLFSSIIVMSLWFTLHYPWRIQLNRSATSNVYCLSSNHTSSSVLKVSPNKERFDEMLQTINKLIPQDASIAFRVDAGFEAYVTNRQKAWILGCHPEGVEYYIIQKKAISEIRDVDYPRWQDIFENIKHDKNLKVIYEDEFMAIYKNIKPAEIPRIEGALGWDIFDAVLFGKEKPLNKK